MRHDIPGHDREAVTLDTLHGDLAALRGETREGFADLKATLVTGFRNLPSREQTEEMLRLLREGNQLHEERFAQLDARIRGQHLELQQALRVLAGGQPAMLDGQRALHEDLRALIARLDALIRRRGDGSPAA